MNEPEEAGVKQDIEKGFKIAGDKESEEPESKQEEKNGETEEETKQREGEEKERVKEQRIHDLVNTTKYSEFYQRLIPNKHFKEIPADDARVYGGRFTAKGNLYYCSSQQSINLYDTSDPYNWSLKS